MNAHDPNLHVRNDCCSKCKIEKECDKCIARCYPLPMNEVQCQTCKICLDFTLVDGTKPYKADLSTWGNHLKHEMEVSAREAEGREIHG